MKDKTFVINFQDFLEQCLLIPYERPINDLLDVAGMKVHPHLSFDHFKGYIENNVDGIYKYYFGKEKLKPKLDETQFNDIGMVTGVGQSNLLITIGGEKKTVPTSFTDNILAFEEFISEIPYKRITSTIAEICLKNEEEMRIKSCLEIDLKKLEGKRIVNLNEEQLKLERVATETELVSESLSNKSFQSRFKELSMIDVYRQNNNMKSCKSMNNMRLFNLISKKKTKNEIIEEVEHSRSISKFLSTHFQENIINKTPVSLKQLKMEQRLLYKSMRDTQFKKGFEHEQVYASNKEMIDNNTDHNKKEGSVNNSKVLMKKSSINLIGSKENSINVDIADERDSANENKMAIELIKSSLTSFEKISVSHVISNNTKNNQEKASIFSKKNNNLKNIVKDSVSNNNSISRNSISKIHLIDREKQNNLKLFVERMTQKDFLSDQRFKDNVNENLMRTFDVLPKAEKKPQTVSFSISNYSEMNKDSASKGEVLNREERDGLYIEVMEEYYQSLVVGNEREYCEEESLNFLIEQPEDENLYTNVMEEYYQGLLIQQEESDENLYNNEMENYYTDLINCIEKTESLKKQVSCLAVNEEITNTTGSDIYNKTQPTVSQGEQVDTRNEFDQESSLSSKDEFDKASDQKIDKMSLTERISNRADRSLSKPNIIIKEEIDVFSKDNTLSHSVQNNYESQQTESKKEELSPLQLEEVVIKSNIVSEKPLSNKDTSQREQVRARSNQNTEIKKIVTSKVKNMSMGKKTNTHNLNNSKKVNKNIIRMKDMELIKRIKIEDIQVKKENDKTKSHLIKDKDSPAYITKGLNLQKNNNASTVKQNKTTKNESKIKKFIFNNTKGKLINKQELSKRKRVRSIREKKLKRNRTIEPKPVAKHPNRSMGRSLAKKKENFREHVLKERVFLDKTLTKNNQLEKFMSSKFSIHKKHKSQKLPSIREAKGGSKYNKKKILRQINEIPHKYPGNTKFQKYFNHKVKQRKERPERDTRNPSTDLKLLKTKSGNIISPYDLLYTNTFLRSKFNKELICVNGTDNFTFGSKFKFKSIEIKKKQHS